jgi:hypothetical protein
VVTIIWEGSDFERDARKLLDYRPRWRDGFSTDAGLLGFVAFLGISGAINRCGEQSAQAWTMAFVGFLCLFAALAQRTVLVEVPVWLVCSGLGRLPRKVTSPADAWSSTEWRTPQRIARELLNATGDDPMFGVTFRSIGVTRCYVDRRLLPQVRAVDRRQEFDVFPDGIDCASKLKHV